jgi:hypothetical protein
MSFRLKLPLAPAISALVALFGASACASAAPISSVYSPPSDDAGSSPSPSDDASSPPASGKDSGSPTTSGDSGGTTSCTLPDTWSQSATCDACQVAHCCSLIAACAADTACTAIYTCQANCYSGVGPDGGTISSAPIDDAGDSAEDTCAADCFSAGSPAAQKLFTPQDTCVNTTSCSGPCD